MFWNKDKKSKKKPAKDLRAEAMNNVRAARNNIGEDTLDRIAAAMTAKQKSSTEQAKAQIVAQDTERVVMELKYLIDQSETRH